MFGLTFLDISASLGLCGTVLLTVNFLLGMLLGTPYKRSVRWQRLPASLRKISIYDLHNRTAYVALIFVVAHPLFLLLDDKSGFKFKDVLLPLGAPRQGNMVMLGSLSLFALLVVMITTQKAVKNKMSFRTWKNIHLLSYGTALLFIFHGLLMDPELKDRPTDWLDAEKLLSEFCLLVLIVAGSARYRYYIAGRVTRKKIMQ